MVSVWQAHLSFVLLGFVLLSRVRFTAPWRPWLLPMLVVLSFIPVNELPSWRDTAAGSARQTAPAAALDVGD